MPDTKDVANWMAHEFDAEGILYQHDAVAQILIRFGEEFIRINQNGNQAINTLVLSEFRRLTADSAIWDRAGLFWRKRGDFDEPGRRKR